MIIMTLGLVGLIRAAQNYDESKGVAFSTLAVSCIRFEISNEIRRKNTYSRIANDNTVSIYTPTVEGEEDTALANIISDDFDMEEYILKREKLDLIRKGARMLTRSGTTSIEILFRI